MRQPVPERVRRSDVATRAAYERLPYPSLPNPQSHPDKLATLGVLHGMELAPLATCRVLEVGCSDGGNLIPMAFEFPQGRFVGIDLSPRQIASGRDFLRACGLSNIELLEMSLHDLDGRLGEFDYILVHGVYSWVSQAARERILAICKERLAPQGIAYVSYNTLPGWHFRNVLRDLMRYGTRRLEDPLARIEKGAQLVQFLADSVVERDDAYGRFLGWCQEHLADHASRPSYLAHEYLEEHNAPLYFHEFMAQASTHGLQYLAEAEQQLMEVANLPTAVAEELCRLASGPIELEQYLDFLGNRPFRQTLLCHQGLPLDRTLVVERMRRFFVASPARPETPDPSLQPEVPVSFRMSEARVFSSRHPLAKAALLRLAEAAPEALPFDRLCREVRRRLGPAAAGVPEAEADADRETLADFVYSSYFGGVIDLHLRRPPFTTRIGDRPAVSPLARLQATRGPLVTNFWHQAIRLDDELARALLPELDGRNDRAALIEFLRQEVEAGRLAIQLDGRPVDAGPGLEPILARLLEEQLRTIRGHALLWPGR